MSESEIARIRETITKEYLAARWGLIGETFGTTKHAFIAARMKGMEEGYKELEAYVGDEALALVVETLKNVPVVPTREFIIKLLRHAFGDDADTEYLINDIERLWQSSDLLFTIFGEGPAYKMVNAP